MRKHATGGVLVFCALALLASPIHPEQHLTIKLSYENDPRYLALRSFLDSQGYPIASYAAHFLAAADRYGLDWRLLPAIAIVESSGGKRYSGNNIFGWNGCETDFPTVPAGIFYVASRLAHSDLYRGKDLHQLLRTYNPRPAYPARVRSCMRALSRAACSTSPAQPTLAQARRSGLTPSFEWRSTAPRIRATIARPSLPT